MGEISFWLSDKQRKPLQHTKQSVHCLTRLLNIRHLTIIYFFEQIVNSFGKVFVKKTMKCQLWGIYFEIFSQQTEKPVICLSAPSATGVYAHNSAGCTAQKTDYGGKHGVHSDVNVL